MKGTLILVLLSLNQQAFLLKNLFVIGYNMKAFVILICLVIQIQALSQSKKEQIYILNQRLDSLNQVLNFERNITIKNIGLKDSTISIINIQNDNLNDSINRLNSNLSSLNYDLMQEKSLIESLRKEFSNKVETLNDTITRLNSKISTLNIELIREKSLIESMGNELSTITDSLKLLLVHNNIENKFTLNCSNSILYYDKETAEFYGGDTPNLADFGKVTVVNSVYNEGIMFSQRFEYEGAIYQLFIPLINLTDVKKNIDRLCRNMGGCISPEEMEINYEVTEFGIKITWGGGC
ncbi:hypothetical protein EBU71_21690 [bacterium]|nr:hypothetical protein [Candidatus Elulimicrobium humile]